MFILSNKICGYFKISKTYTLLGSRDCLKIVNTISWYEHKDRITPSDRQNNSIDKKLTLLNDY